jgi:hypothetical protein
LASARLDRALVVTSHVRRAVGVLVRVGTVFLSAARSFDVVVEVRLSVGNCQLSR